MDGSLLTGAGDGEVSVAMSHAHNPNPLRFESPDIRDQVEVTTLNIENSSIVTGIGGQILVSTGDEEQNTTDLTPPELHDYSDPKDSAYLLRVYPTFLGLVAGKFTWEKHTPIPTTNPFMIISVVVYAMAYLNLVILPYMYDRLKIQSHQHFSLSQYMITKYVFLHLVPSCTFLADTIVIYPSELDWYSIYACTFFSHGCLYLLCY